jgi:hypothetical protein
MPSRTISQSELESFPHLDWLAIAPRLSLDVRNPIEHVLETQNGSSLSREQTLPLANAEGDDLLGLLVAADLLRCELAGNIVTYVVNRNINFTNIAARVRRTLISSIHNRSQTRPLKPGNLARRKSAFRVGCRATSILFIIAISFAL